MESDFSYVASDRSLASPQLTLSILSDRAHVRGALRDEARAAGARLAFVGSLDKIAACGADNAAFPALGDLVWIDCPRVNAVALAAMCRLDALAAGGMPGLIVSTSVDALDDIFAWLDQSEVTFLVDPSPADRAIALARAMVRHGAGRVREFSDDDKMLLQRLTEEVGRIAGWIDRLSPGEGGTQPVRPALFRPAPFGGEGGAPARISPVAGEVGRSAAATLPDAKLIRRIIRQRELRACYFGADLFADPAWDMLLDLAAARAERRRVSVTSLCIASGVPPTTALRWIGQMVEQGLFVRVCDDTDRRRAFIELSEPTVHAMSRYFQEMAITDPVPV